MLPDKDRTYRDRVKHYNPGIFRMMRFQFRRIEP